MSVERSITVKGTSYGRSGVSVTFTDEGLTGDPFVVEIVEDRVAMGWAVSVPGVTAGLATLSLDDPLLTAATIAEAFDSPAQDVKFVGVDAGDDTPEKAVN